MSIATLIMGKSGTGKTASLRNINPEDCLLVQSISKPLPFRGKGWAPLVTDSVAKIKVGMEYAYNKGRKIVIIDDFQYILANEFMRRVTDKEAGNGAFQKFNEIAKSGWDLFNAAMNAPDDMRVYILSHTQEDEYGGNAKIKTVGKLLDEKVVLEGMVTTVLRSHVSDGRYYFTTQNDGSDTVKSPMGLFDEMEIDNDLKMIDDKICEYYGIGGDEK